MMECQWIVCQGGLVSQECLMCHIKVAFLGWNVAMGCLWYRRRHRPGGAVIWFGRTPLFDVCLIKSLKLHVIMKCPAYLIPVSWNVNLFQTTVRIICDCNWQPIKYLVMQMNRPRDSVLVFLCIFVQLMFYCPTSWNHNPSNVLSGGIAEKNYFKERHYCAELT